MNLATSCPHSRLGMKTSLLASVPQAESIPVSLEYPPKCRTLIIPLADFVLFRSSDKVVAVMQDIASSIQDTVIHLQAEIDKVRGSEQCWEPFVVIAQSRIGRPRYRCWKFLKFKSSSKQRRLCGSQMCLSRMAFGFESFRLPYLPLSTICKPPLARVHDAGLRRELIFILQSDTITRTSLLVTRSPCSCRAQAICRIEYSWPKSSAIGPMWMTTTRVGVRCCKSTSWRGRKQSLNSCCASCSLPREPHSSRPHTVLCRD